MMKNDGIELGPFAPYTPAETRCPIVMPLFPLLDTSITLFRSPFDVFFFISQASSEPDARSRTVLPR
jgi:hypothetical protein